MRWSLLLCLLLLGAAFAPALAQAPYELSLGYAAPAAGDLDTAWDAGAALDVRLPLRAGRHEYLSLDLGGQLYSTTAQNTGTNLRGLRMFVTEHLASPHGAGRFQAFAGLGVQALWTGTLDPLPGATAPGARSGTRATFSGWGPAATVGAGLTLLGTPGRRIQLQGSWTLARLEGAGQSYGVLAVAYLVGR